MKKLSSHKEVQLFTDGGSRGNPGIAAGGFVVLDMEGSVLGQGGVYLGITTNNQAEYQGLIHGLRLCRKFGAQVVHVHMDSNLIVNQMLGKYRVKHPELKPRFAEVIEEKHRFVRVEFKHVRREYNKLADKMANLAMDKEKNI